MSESTPDKKPPATSTGRLSSEGCRALEMLATSGPSGATEAILMAHGFPAGLLAGLARNGLVAESIGTVRAGARMLQVRHLSITNTGRLVLAVAQRRRRFRT
jgi:hypothetical protein